MLFISSVQVQSVDQSLATLPSGAISSERFANHRLVTGGRTGEGCDSSQVTNLPLVGQPIG